MTPAAVGAVVRTMGPPPPVVVGSGGTTMLLVSAIALTSRDQLQVARGAFGVGPLRRRSVMRLNCGMLALAGTDCVKLAVPCQLSMRCVMRRAPRADCVRAQSAQSVASGEAVSQS
jgi:hypothetical protein